MHPHLHRVGKPRPDGFALVAVVAIVTVLLATGMAFMRWNVDESMQTQQSNAAIQAYYLAQLGIVEQGFQYLRKLPASQLPVAQTDLPGRVLPAFGNFDYVRYDNVKIYWLVPEGESGDFWSLAKRYKIVADGIVRAPFMEHGRASFKEIRRRATLYVQVRNFADYMYLTNYETTGLGEIIRFWTGDTLQGRTHSNDVIAIRDRPVFYETVSSCAPDYLHGPNANPQFLGTPPTRWNADSVLIPAVAENLRLCASSQGHYLSNPGMAYHARFSGSTVFLYWWPIGTIPDSTRNTTIALIERTCIFIDGPVDLYGTVQGQVTIGCSGVMRILDNIRYTDADPNDGRLPDEDGDGMPNESCKNILGLVSENDIKVANTWANGRENSGGLGWDQTNQARTSVVITAAVVALGESFTFEQQNDPDSGYVYTVNGIPHRDDRGTIYLFGSVTQQRRGYVHRTTNGSTGYLKQYRYDKRLLTTRPPGFFDAKDEHGRALFDVVQWGKGVPDAAEAKELNRFN